MPKPEVITFFTRGWPFDCAMEVLDRWDSLSEPARELATKLRWRNLTRADAVTLGFIPARPAGEALH